VLSGSAEPGPSSQLITGDYRATQPKVERILAHLVLRRHGGRRARVRDRRKVVADFDLLAASRNLARLGLLGLRSAPDGWMAPSPEGPKGTSAHQNVAARLPPLPRTP